VNTIIEKFKTDKNIALIGVSMVKQKYGNYLLTELIQKGYNVFPVHPTLKETGGLTCVSDIRALPDNVTNLILVVKPEVTEQIIPQLKDSHIKRVWMHKGAGKGSGSEAAIKACKELGIEAVYGLCPMMFFSPSGLHSLHFWMRKTFGQLPAEYNK
jgi:predicted CoA-binding protein